MLKTDPNDRITTAQIVDGLISGSQFLEKPRIADVTPVKNYEAVSEAGSNLVTADKNAK